MSHGFELEPAKGPAIPDNLVVAGISKLMDAINKAALNISMVALVLTALILTYSVITRYFLKVPTDWQDEASVFMLVGATFICAAYVQSYRGHIGIDDLFDEITVVVASAFAGPGIAGRCGGFVHGRRTGCWLICSGNIVDSRPRLQLRPCWIMCKHRSLEPHSLNCGGPAATGRFPTPPRLI